MVELAAQGVARFFSNASRDEAGAPRRPADHDFCRKEGQCKPSIGDRVVIVRGGEPALRTQQIQSMRRRAESGVLSIAIRSASMQRRDRRATRCSKVAAGSDKAARPERPATSPHCFTSAVQSEIFPQGQSVEKSVVDKTTDWRPRDAARGPTRDCSRQSAETPPVCRRWRLRPAAYGRFPLPGTSASARIALERQGK